ncbi:hypothetical protein HFD88_007237 [Aspergillus terreus]|nr:hypothetical protein HFD88_007237 [Aspergillus terreus]
MSAQSILSKIFPHQDLGPIPAVRIVVLIAVSTALYGLLNTLYNLFLHPLRSVPGPFLAKVSPLWNTYIALTAQQPFKIKEAHERYGPVIRIGPNELRFASPTAMTKIYTQGKGAPLKAGFYSQAIPIKEQHSFSIVDKHQHLARKKLISRCFSPSHQAKFLEGVKELSIDLNRLLARKASESVDNVVDVYHLLNMFTFESVYLLSFEEPLRMIKTGEEHRLMHLANRTAASLVIAVVLPFTRRFLYRIPGRMFDDFRAVHEWKQYYIDRMRALTKSSQSPFLSQLLNTTSEEHNRPLNESEAAEELIALMFAGSETVGVTMNWLLWELAHHPEVQEKLFKEICEVMPSPTSSVPYDELANLPFLRAVIKETLRVHTAILGPFPRVTVEDMVIEGQAVPKGSVVNMCTYVTQ